MVKFLPTQDYVKSRLDYDPLTGHFYWRTIENDVDWNAQWAGRQAGSKKTYVEITIDAKCYLAHRLAWLLMTGEWPNTQIDHKDGDRWNNSFSNLRLANPSDQRANSRLMVTNTTGVKGVCKVGKRFQAAIQRDKKVRYLGRFDTIEEAAAAYRRAALLLHGEFARF